MYVTNIAHKHPSGTFAWNLGMQVQGAALEKVQVFQSKNYINCHNQHFDEIRVVGRKYGDEDKMSVYHTIAIASNNPEATTMELDRGLKTVVQAGGFEEVRPAA